MSSPSALPPSATESEELRVRQAADILAGGERKYIFRFAFLRIWLPVTAVLSLLLGWLMPAFTPLKMLPLPPGLRWMGLLIPGAVIASVAWGRLMWRQYQAYWAPRVANVTTPDLSRAERRKHERGTR